MGESSEARSKAYIRYGARAAYSAEAASAAKAGLEQRSPLESKNSGRDSGFARKLAAVVRRS